MPQMAPISWLILFLLFSITFIMFNILNYYIFMYPSNKSLLKKKLLFTNFNWKW